MQEINITEENKKKLETIMLNEELNNIEEAIDFLIMLYHETI